LENKSKFSIELTTTQACNFKCEYCFENDCQVPDDNRLSKEIDYLVLSLKKLFLDEWFTSRFGSTQLTFWGGEPSLNMVFIERICNEFESYDNVGFYIYTNGSRIKDLLPILIRMKDKSIGSMPKFTVQLSYDGDPVHGMRRTTKDDSSSTELVREAIDLLHENDIKYSLKSTLSHKDFKYLPEIWEDIYFLYEAYGSKINYSVTIDYHNIEVGKYLNNLEEALIKVAKKEYVFYKEEGRFLSNIFSSNKKFCSAGKNMITVDVDGKLYLCHGCCYSDCASDFCTGSLFNTDLIEPIKHNYEIFYKTNKSVDECERCVAISCLRCNVKKYEMSSKDIFLERWHDYPCQEELCLYYKTTGRIGRALIELIEEDKLWDAH